MSPTPSRASVVRATPVRITVDLSPQAYRGLIDYAASLAVTKGRFARVHVIHALVAELIADEDLEAIGGASVRAQLDDYLLHNSVNT